MDEALCKTNAPCLLKKRFVLGRQSNIEWTILILTFWFWSSSRPWKSFYIFISVCMIIFQEQHDNTHLLFRFQVKKNRKEKLGMQWMSILMKCFKFLLFFSILGQRIWIMFKECWFSECRFICTTVLKWKKNNLFYSLIDYIYYWKELQMYLICTRIYNYNEITLVIH